MQVEKASGAIGTTSRLIALLASQHHIQTIFGHIDAHRGTNRQVTGFMHT
jgi:hypothetical protein